MSRQKVKIEVSATFIILPEAYLEPWKPLMTEIFLQK